MILLLDNFDSFVHNLGRYFERLGQTTQVIRNDALNVESARRLNPDAIVISPGPCTPSEAGCSLEIVREMGKSTPTLGICLGHQAIGAAFGARVIRAREPVHGRESRVYHQGTGLFAEIPNPFLAGRYHSLVVDEASLPADLRATAHAEDGTLMAIEHQRLPIVGWQFHPESILTECGYTLLANFLRFAGLAVPHQMPTRDDEWLAPKQPLANVPAGPVTF